MVTEISELKLIVFFPKHPRFFRNYGHTQKKPQRTPKKQRHNALSQRTARDPLITMHSIQCYDQTVFSLQRIFSGLFFFPFILTPPRKKTESKGDATLLHQLDLFTTCKTKTRLTEIKLTKERVIISVNKKRSSPFAAVFKHVSAIINRYTCNYDAIDVSVITECN